MPKAVILFFLAVCLIEAPPIDDLINELKPEVEEALLNVADVVKRSGEKIKLAYREIGTSVSELGNEIDERRLKIEDDVKQAEKVAKDSGKNISACVEKEKNGLRAINRTSLELCRISSELNKQLVTIAALAKQEAVIATALIKCPIQHTGNLDEIRTCVEDIISNAERQADEIESSIDSSVTRAVDKSIKCETDTVCLIRTHLEKVKNDFNECVSQV